jgi:hypothetical protein
MSWRQPLVNSTAVRAKENKLSRNKVDSFATDFFQKRDGFLRLKLGVSRFDAQEKFVDRGALEPRHVENGVVRPRQSVHREHADDGSQGGA